MADAVSAARKRLRQVSLIYTEFAPTVTSLCRVWNTRAIQRAWGHCSLCPQLCGHVWVSKSLPGTIPADTNLVCCPICRGLTQMLRLFSHPGCYLEAIILESTPNHPGGDGGGQSSTPCRAHSQGLGLHTYYLPAHAQSETLLEIRHCEFWSEGDINLNKKGDIIPLCDERHRARDKTPPVVCRCGLVRFLCLFVFEGFWGFLRTLKHLQIFHAGNSDTGLSLGKKKSQKHNITLKLRDSRMGKNTITGCHCYCF